jgi:hypothetical protein
MDAAFISPFAFAGSFAQYLPHPQDTAAEVLSMARPVASLDGCGKQPVYLLDFSVYKPPEELRLNRDEAEVKARQW